MDAEVVLFLFFSQEHQGVRFGHDYVSSLRWLFLPMVRRDETLDERGIEQRRMHTWELRWKRSEKDGLDLPPWEAPGVQEESSVDTGVEVKGEGLGQLACSSSAALVPSIS